MEKYQREIKDIIDKSDNYLKSHVGIQGQHFEEWIDCQSIFRDPIVVKKICDQLCKPFIQRKIRPTLIVGQGHHGYIMAGEMGLTLNTFVTYAHKDMGSYDTKLYEFAEIKKSDQVLLVDDGINLGTTILQMIEIIENLDANVVGVATLINRYPAELTDSVFSVPIAWGYKYNGPIHQSEHDCPLCVEILRIQRQLSENNLSAEQIEKLQRRLQTIKFKKII